MWSVSFLWGKSFGFGGLGFGGLGFRFLFCEWGFSGFGSFESELATCHNEVIALKPETTGLD